MRTSERNAVASLGRSIAQLIGEPRYDFWFARNTKFTLEDDQLVVGVPNHFYLEWLQNRFTDAVSQAAASVVGRSLEIRFIIDPALFQAARQAQAELKQGIQQAEATGAEGRPRKRAATAAPVPPSHSAGQALARRWRLLGDFIVGPCNRVAHAAALSAVESPDQAMNPLVLHGPVGTGKTHLLEGIHAGLRKADPRRRLLYVTAEGFTNRFVQAMRSGKLGAFRLSFRECDTLLVDDIQFFANKRATQEEFLHTFDALLANGKQIVLSCDCHPSLTDDLTPELRDRLAGGAAWSLMPPEQETRLSILRARSAQLGSPLGEEVLHFLAQRLRGNVRELEGALHIVRHYAQVAEKPVDLDLTREALGDLLRHSIRAVHLEDIERAVCKVLHLPEGSLQAKSRNWSISHPRMLAVFLARKHTSAAYSEIGRYFGGRNHSTAVAAEKRIRQWLRTGEDLTLGGRGVKLPNLIELIERELGR